MATIESYSENILIYIRKKLKEKYGNKRPLRIFHAKSIGLVEAEFKVNPDLKEWLKIGLFKEEKTYKAWVRFSNGSPTPGADGDKSTRGMAIKVLGVESAEFLDDDPEGKTQDIILINSPNFVPGSAALALNGVKIILGKPWEIARNFLNVAFVSTRGIIPFLRTVKQSPNVLEEAYYSTAPYAFGEKQVIKWYAKPLKTVTSTMPKVPDENFLRHRLIEDLSDDAKDNVSFTLYVQFHENEETEPIDDTSVVWKTKPHPVATIILPKQNINTDERLSKDVKIAFSPGHSMIEHQPVGGVNMVRRMVYRALAKERASFEQASL